MCCCSSRDLRQIRQTLDKGAYLFEFIEFFGVRSIWAEYYTSTPLDTNAFHPTDLTWHDRGTPPRGAASVGRKPQSTDHFRDAAPGVVDVLIGGEATHTEADRGMSQFIRHADSTQHKGRLDRS